MEGHDICGYGNILQFSLLVKLLSGASIAYAKDAHVRAVEIVVTAQKRAENVKDIPITINLLTAQDLELARINNTQQLSALEPSLVFTTNTAFGQPYLRGVGSDLFSPGAEASIATYVDNIYQPRSVSSVQSLFDMEHLAVVKGPQGVFFGRNAVGGAISLTTQKPTYALEGEVDLSYGNFDQTRIEGHINIPLVETKAALRVSGLSENRDGFTENIQTGGDIDSADLLAFRTHLTLDVSDKLGLLLSANYSTEDSSRNLAARVNPEGGPAIADFFGAIRPEDSFQLAANDDGRLNLDTYSLSATANYNLGWANLKTITAYNDTDLRQSVDFDASQLDFARNSGFQTSEAFTQELLLISQNQDNLDWVLGLFYLNEDASQEITNRLNFPIAVPNTLDQVGGSVQTKSIGVFGNVKYHFDETWALSAGLRYNYDRRELDFIQNTTFFDAFPMAQPGTEGASLTLAIQNQDEASYDAFTPNFTLEHKFADDSLFFASISRGYKAGGFNTNVNQSSFEEESLWAYEAGYKKTLFNDRAYLNAAAFIYDYSDLQLLTIPPGAPAGTFQIVINAGEATIKGAELDLSLSATKNVDFNFSMALLDAQYDSFVATNPNVPDQLDVNRQGERLPRAPEFSFAAGAQYITDIWGRDTRLQTNLRYESFQFLDAFQDSLVSRDENITLDAQLQHDLKDSIYLTLWAKNLTNEETVGSALRVDGLFGVIEFFMPPRTYGASLTVGF